MKWYRPSWVLVVVLGLFATWVFISRGTDEWTETSVDGYDVSPREEEFELNQKLGKAVALLEGGQHDALRDALDGLEQLEPRFNSVQRQQVLWIRGVIFLREHKFESATAAFAELARDNASPFATDAEEMLVVAYARSGYIAEANAAFARWVVRAQPDARRASPLLELIERSSVGDHSK